MGSQPSDGSAEPKHTLFYFHSCCSDGWHVMGLLRKLKDYVNNEDIKVVVPSAPERIEVPLYPPKPSDKVIAGIVSSWYLYKSGTEGPHPTRGREELKEVKEYLEIGFAEEFERVTKTGGKIFMYGISQGVSVMTHLLLHCDSKFLKKVALVVCNRGWCEDISMKQMTKEKKEELMELREKCDHDFPYRNPYDISERFYLADPKTLVDKPLLKLEYPIFFAVLAGRDNCCLPHISTKLYNKLERYFPITYLFNDAISHGCDWPEEADIIAQAIKEFLPDSHKTGEYNKEGIVLSPRKRYTRVPAYEVDRLPTR